MPSSPTTPPKPAAAAAAAAVAPPPPPPAPLATHRQRPSSTSYLSSFIRWLQLKKYQYEVTFSLYMLTSTEKIIFNVILLTLLFLLITAAIMYLPNHVAIIYNRIWYYVHGELASLNGSSSFSVNSGAHTSSSNILFKPSSTVATIADSLRGSGAKQKGTAAVVIETLRSVVDEL